MSVGTSQGDINTTLDRVSYRIAEKTQGNSPAAASPSPEKRTWVKAPASHDFFQISEEAESLPEPAHFFSLGQIILEKSR